MKLPSTRSIVLLAAGAFLCAVVMQFLPRQEIKASVALGNDKFSMCTVPIAPGEGEAVFVLNHLTGVLRGAALNNTTGTFTHHYLRNVAADFQSAAVTPEPKFAIVSAMANLRGSGRVQPANGVLYIGELSSGAVISYTFQMPRGNAVTAPMEVIRGDAFLFAEAVGR